jgi:secondary thiamine-phosphate synthase enzyme
MKVHTDSFTVSTRGKGTYEVTADVARIVRASGITTGTATVFLQHTSASLVIYENADHSARADLHAFFERLVPEDEDYYEHTAEGSDDTTSHLRMGSDPVLRVHPLAQGQTRAGHLAGGFRFRAPPRAASAEYRRVGRGRVTGSGQRAHAARKLHDLAQG